ncbi:MAG: HpaII family restriction endonuclease [Chitinophagaceae bacterium]|nr:HpaII family restriction endonuclease [Chitinophagaceae bacterium]
MIKHFEILEQKGIINRLYSDFIHNYRLLPIIQNTSTLLNASKATNFIYKLSKNLTNSQINEINSIKNFIDKFNKLSEFNSSIKFVETENPVFGNNLVLIDSLLPKIMADLLIYFFSTKSTSISELTNLISVRNPVEYDLRHNHDFYNYKIKHLLTDIALGLMPTKVWTGKYDATGGYLVVKENGEIVAYHLYNKNEFEDYLFYNTKLETASTSRHEFGSIYFEGDKQFIKLNLQIRFKK